MDIPKLVQYLRYDIWRIQARKLPRRRSLLIRPLRVFLLSVRGFHSDQCSLRASALTFYSLLSIVPVFAMAFGIAKGFGVESILEARLMEQMEGRQEVVRRVIEFARSLLENTRGGVVAGIGIVVLFWTVVRVLGNIEMSFNEIWGVKEHRSWSRKFSDYLSMMLICPILLIISSSATVFITAQVARVTEHMVLSSYLGPVIMLLLKLLPFAVVWLLLSYIYVAMPNTEVKVSSAFVGAVIAGTAYQLTQWVYITFQIGASRFGAIYGSFAALPLFLIWLQISWLIVLFGAEICFAYQNEETYEYEPDALEASPAFRKLVALRILHLVVRRFTAGETPLTAEAIAETLETPVRLVRIILNDLVSARLLSETPSDRDKDPRFQPARDVENLTLLSALEDIERQGKEALPLAEDAALRRIREAIDAIADQARQSDSNLLLRNLESLPSGRFEKTPRER